MCGEWKLGGLEYVSPIDGNPMPPIKLPPILEVYDPPEKSDPSKLKSVTKWYGQICMLFLPVFLKLTKINFSSTDMWGLGCLVWESYNGPLKNRVSLKEINNVSTWNLKSARLLEPFDDGFSSVLDSEIGDTVILWIGRRKSVESTESCRHNNEMPQTGRVLQEWFGRHSAVSRRNPNQRQGWKITFLQFNDCATRQFSAACLQVRFGRCSTFHLKWNSWTFLGKKFFHNW